MTTGDHQRHQGQSWQTVDAAVRQEETEVDHQVSGAEEAVRGELELKVQGLCVFCRHVLSPQYL